MGNISNYINKITSPGKKLLSRWAEWLGLLLLTATVGTAIFSVQSANWITPQPSIMTVLLLAIILGSLMAKSRWNSVATTFLSILCCIIVAIWQSSSILPSPDATSIVDRISGSISILWQTLSQSTPNEGTIYFALLLIILSWFLGYLLAWRFWRKLSIWPSIILGLITLLINLEYLNNSYYYYFFIYVFFAIFTLGYVNLLKQRSVFKESKLKFPVKAILLYSILMLLISAIMVGGVRAAPEIHANQLQSYTESKVQPGQFLNDLKLNFFASVKAKGTVIKSADQNALFFSTPPNLSEDIQFIIDSPSAPSYWRVKRYDLYNQWGWSVSPSIENDTNTENITKNFEANASRTQLTYTVITKIKTDIVLTAGKLESSSVPLMIYSFTAKNSSQNNIAVAAKAIPDDQMSSIITPRLYKPDESYTLTVEIIKPDTEQLLGAGDNYPSWITNQYLQLPSSLPLSVQRLSRSLTRDKGTPYEKVRSILEYLSQYQYVAAGTVPPPGADAVENFLTVARSGNCTSFASAAVVLLRASGVPARLCTGYLPHNVDKSSGQYLVQARDYHAWAEVYFPNYGWVEFETTPAVAPVNIPSSQTNQSGNNTSSNNSIPNYFPGYDFPTPTFPADNSAASTQLDTRNNIYLFVSIPLTILILLGISWFLFMRHFKRRDYISELYARLYFVASLIGVTPHPQQTPLEFSEKLVRLLPAYRDSVQSITNTYVESRYGRKMKLTLLEKDKLRRCWRSLLFGIVKHRFFRVKTPTIPFN